MQRLNEILISLGTNYPAEISILVAKEGVLSEQILNHQIAILGDQPTAAHWAEVQSKFFVTAAICADAHVTTSNNSNCGSWAQAQAAPNRYQRGSGWTTQDVHNSRCWIHSGISLCQRVDISH